MKSFQRTVTINAPPSAVWHGLTNLEAMKQWMAEPEMQLDINTDWQLHSPVIIKGYHHVPFVNKGTVLEVDPHKRLRYTHLSSISRLPDHPGSYTTLDFALRAVSGKTELTLSISNFPTDAIFKHMDFYWKATIELFKKWIEERHSKL